MYNKNIKKKSIALATVALVAANSTCVFAQNDKKITKVEYSGTNTDSSDCVYIFAVIDFKSDPNYVVYSNEVILHKDYESNISEMLDILKNAKLN